MANRTKQPFPVLTELRAIRDRMSKALNSMSATEQEAFLEKGSEWFNKAIAAKRAPVPKRTKTSVAKSPIKRRAKSKQRA